MRVCPESLTIEQFDKLKGVGVMLCMTDAVRVVTLHSSTHVTMFPDAGISRKVTIPFHVTDPAQRLQSYNLFGGPKSSSSFEEMAA